MSGSSVLHSRSILRGGIPTINFSFLTQSTRRLILAPDVALRGFRYVASFVFTFVTPIPLLLAGGFVAWKRAAKPDALALLTLTLAFPSYAVVVGGDWMPMGRFLVPGFAFGALLMGCLVAWLWERSGASLKRIGEGFAVVAISIALLPAWDFHLVPESLRWRFHFRYDDQVGLTEYDVWKQAQDERPAKQEVALALRTHLNPEESTLVLNAIGEIGYYSSLTIYDRYGLLDRRVALLPRDPSQLGTPGHDAGVEPSFFIQDEPTVFNYQLTKSKNKTELLRDIRIRTKEWAKDRRVWRLYAPDFLPMKTVSRR